MALALSSTLRMFQGFILFSFFLSAILFSATCLSRVTVHWVFSSKSTVRDWTHCFFFFLYYKEHFNFLIVKWIIEKMERKVQRKKFTHNITTQNHSYYYSEKIERKVQRKKILPLRENHWGLPVLGTACMELGSYLSHTTSTTKKAEWTEN